MLSARYRQHGWNALRATPPASVAGSSPSAAALVPLVASAAPAKPCCATFRAQRTRSCKAVHGLAVSW